MNIDFSPLEKWDEGLWGWSNSKEFSDDGEEIRLEIVDNLFALNYATGDVHGWEVYRGEIPTREFFENLLKYGEGVKDLKLV